MPFPTVEEEAYHRLHRACWTLGIYSLAGPIGVVCVVEGVNGENLIRGEGRDIGSGVSLRVRWVCWDARPGDRMNDRYSEARDWPRTRSVGAEQAEHLALTNSQRQSVHGSQMMESLRERVRFDNPRRFGYERSAILGGPGWPGFAGQNVVRHLRLFYAANLQGTTEMTASGSTIVFHCGRGHRMFSCAGTIAKPSPSERARSSPPGSAGHNRATSQRGMASRAAARG
jgi:hypothetical protein